MIDDCSVPWWSWRLMQVSQSCSVLDCTSLVVTPTMISNHLLAGFRQVESGLLLGMLPPQCYGSTTNFPRFQLSLSCFCPRWYALLPLSSFLSARLKKILLCLNQVSHLHLHWQLAVLLSFGLVLHACWPCQFSMI